jgi:endonuclease/exonuclease/phosphatase family metal-dependent hydrolase
VLRVACWNVWGFSWEWPRRRPLVAAELADLKPDALFLHEARAARRTWENGESTPEQVAADSGLSVVDWIDARTSHPDTRMGPALLARQRPVRTSRFRLADRGTVANLGYHEPWLLTADWHIQGSRLVVASTHLPMSGLPEALDASVNNLVEAIQPMTEIADLLVLVGDLNLMPHKSLLYRLMRDLELESAPPLDRALPTYPTSNAMSNRQALEDGVGNLIHPQAPPIRIDHLLVRTKSNSPLNVIAEGRFGTAHRDGDLYASDHWGLWFDVAAT